MTKTVPKNNHCTKKPFYQRILSMIAALALIAAIFPVSFSASAASNEETIYNYLTGTMHLNQAAASGALANIYKESSFNPNATGDGRTSYGICQWHNERWTSLKNYCNNNGYDWTTLNGQLHYLDYELKNYYPGVYSTLTSVANTADGAYNAGYKWCYSYEIPDNKEAVSVERGNLAKNTYWPQYGNNLQSTAETASFISRSDGVWFWPLPTTYYNTFSDWAGCPGTGTCPFCNTTHPSWGDNYHTGQAYGHNGFDVGTGGNKCDVYAAADGTAYLSSQSTNGGRVYYIVVEHQLGNGWSYYSYYQHLSAFSVSNGATVTAGQSIGKVGNTGGDYGIHLHFGMVLGPSGLGVNAPNNLEGKGWVLTSGLKQGRIVVNPALNSPAGFPTGSSDVVPPLKAHAGSVMFTFNKNNVTIGEGDTAYLSKCTEYPSYLTVQTTKTTTVKTLPCSAGTDSNSKDVVTLSSGATFNVTALYKNTANNYWYKGTTSDGKVGYMYSGDTSVKTYRYDDVTISGVSAPSELTVGSRFSIKGTITSTINIISCVNGYIYPNGVTSGSNYKFGETVTVNGRSYSLLNGAIDLALKFNELSAGAYNYVITANVKNYYSTNGSTLNNTSKDVLLVSKPFTVGGVTKYYIDVNGLLDGNEVGNTAGYGTFDMYINGVLDANDVTDYYTQWPNGTKYEIKDIRSVGEHVYNGVTQGTLSGTVGTSAVNIRLSFSSAYILTLNPGPGTCDVTTVSVKKGTKPTSLPSATLMDYTFDGWYTSLFDGTKITTDTTITANATLYAHWLNTNVSKNKIAFYPNGGTLNGVHVSYTLNGYNCGRGNGSLIAYTQPGYTTTTNNYGAEIAVDYLGHVTEKRAYGASNCLTVPDGGYVLSGHHLWDDSLGLNVGGGPFVGTIIGLSDPTLLR